MGAKGFGNAFLFPHVLFWWWVFFVLLSGGARGLSSVFLFVFFSSCISSATRLLMLRLPVLERNIGIRKAFCFAETQYIQC